MAHGHFPLERFNGWIRCDAGVIYAACRQPDKIARKKLAFHISLCDWMIILSAH
jgi:hypothetical protein